MGFNPTRIFTQRVYFLGAILGEIKINRKYKMVQNSYIFYCTKSKKKNP